MKKILILCFMVGVFVWVPTTEIARAQSLSYNMMGSEVTELQQKLKSFGYDLSVTGEYDKATMASVASFQKLNRLSVDGVAGAKTLAALGLDFSKKEAAPTAPSVSAPVVTQTVAPLACDIKNTTPEIRVDAPTGKETLAAGSEILVAWSTCNVPESSELLIQMIRVNAKNQPASNTWVVLDPGALNDGQESVLIPGDVPPGNYTLAIKVAATNTPSDTSDAPFRLTAPTACLAPTITAASIDAVLTKTTQDLLRFTVTNQNTPGTDCVQKVKSIDVAYVATSGTRYHEKLSLKASSSNSVQVFDDSLGGFRFPVNQIEEKSLKPGESQVYAVSGELTNTAPNIAYRGLILGIARVEYEDGPKKTIKTVVPKSIVFGNRFMIQ